MKAAIYLRVGQKEQMDLHSIVDCQRDGLIHAAEAQGLSVQEVYQDIGFSGLNMNRPALQTMLEDAKTGKFDTVLVSNPSRIGRDSAATAQIVKRLQDSGVQVRDSFGVVAGAEYLTMIQGLRRGNTGAVHSGK